MTERYQPARWSPASLGAAIVVNGGVLAALMLAAPHVTRLVPSGGIEAYPVPVDPPPPEPEPVPETSTAPRPFDPPPAPLPYVPPPDVSLPSRGPVVTGTDLMPAAPPSGLPLPAGTGTGTAPVADPLPPARAMTGVSVDPRYRDAFQPDYPAAERRIERDGTVTVRVRVGTSGRVLAVEQVRATSDAFFQATRRQALARWRFVAATEDGVPVESWHVMTVRFEMEALR